MPFVGSALRRNSDILEESDNGVSVPVTNVIDCMLRLLLVLAIPFACLVYVVSKKVSAPVRLTNQELVEAFEFEKDDFVDAIAGCRADQLSEVIDRVPDDPSQPFEQRAALIRNRILAAKKISKTRLPSLQINGIVTELDLRSRLGMWNCERNLFDADEHRDLVALTRLYESVPLYGEDERSQGLMESAKLASIIALTIGWVDNAKEPETATLKKLEAKVKALRVPFLQDSDTGDRLSQMATIARTRLSDAKVSTRVADRLSDLINENYRESEIAIRRNFKLLNCEQSASHFALNNDNSLNEGFISKFQAQFSSMIQIQELSDDDFRLLLEKINTIAESGWTKEAKSALERVMELMDESETVKNELLSEAGLMKERFSWVGQRFEFKGMRTLNDQEVNFPDNGAVTTILLLINNEQKLESNVRLQQMIRVVSDSAGKLALNLCVGFVHDDDKLNGLPQMQEFQQQTREKGVRIWQLNVNSDFWQQQLSRGLKMEDIPMVFIFGDYDKTYCINPNRLETDHLIKKLQAIKEGSFKEDG